MTSGSDLHIADVTSTTPLEVRYKGRKIAVPAVATDVTVAVFDEVVVANIERQIYVLAKLA